MSKFRNMQEMYEINLQHQENKTCESLLGKRIASPLLRHDNKLFVTTFDSCGTHELTSMSSSDFSSYETDGRVSTSLDVENNIASPKSWSPSSQSVEEVNFDLSDETLSKWDDEYRSFGIAPNATAFEEKPIQYLNKVPKMTSNTLLQPVQTTHFINGQRQLDSREIFENKFCTLKFNEPQTSYMNKHATEMCPLAVNKHHQTANAGIFHRKSGSLNIFQRSEVFNPWQLIEIDLPILSYSAPNRLEELFKNYNESTADPRLNKFIIERQNINDKNQRNSLLENYMESQKQKYLSIIGQHLVTSQWFASLPSCEKPRVTKLLILDFLKPLLDYHSKRLQENLNLKFELNICNNAFEIMRILKGLKITATEKGDLISTELSINN